MMLLAICTLTATLGVSLAFNVYYGLMIGRLARENFRLDFANGLLRARIEDMEAEDSNA